MSTLSPAALRQLAHRFAELISAQRVDLLGEVVADGYIQHNPMIPTGLAGLQQASQGFLKAFPDIQVRVDHLVVEGNVIAGHFTWTGTHQGDFLGFAATHKQLSWQSADLWRVENGKFAEHWDVVDWSPLLRQLQAE